jgi:hypothetical protein
MQALWLSTIGWMLVLTIKYFGGLELGQCPTLSSPHSLVFSHLEHHIELYRAELMCAK